MQQKWYAASGYGDGRAADILLFTADADGKMEIRDAVVQGDCPSFLCAADGKLFAASELSDKAAITSFCVENGRLMPEKRIEFSGRGLCHLTAGRQVLYAGCYQSGELYVTDYKLERISCCYHDGIHIHGSICMGGHELLAVELGGDALLKFRLQGKKPVGQPEQIALRAGSGPRQVLYDESSQKMIVINERGNSVAFGSGSNWYRKLVYRPATQACSAANYPGGACIDRKGKLFVANRGADTIAVFDVSKEMIFLGEWDCQGHWPRHLHCADGGLVFAACERSNELCSFLWTEEHLPDNRESRLRDVQSAKEEAYVSGRLCPADSLPLVRAACVTEIKKWPA